MKNIISSSRLIGLLAVIILTAVSGVFAQNRTVYNELSRDYWTGRSGTNVADIPVNNKPTASDILTDFEAVDWTAPTTTQNWADNYGERLMGWLTAPTTGEVSGTIYTTPPTPPAPR